MMKKISLVILFVLAVMNLSAQQKTVMFDLRVPNSEVVPNSLYRGIDFYDTRANYEYNQVKIDAPSFAKRLTSVIESSTDRTSQNGTLLLLLRNLDFKETKEGTNAHIRMNLYSKIGDKYYFITNTDQNIVAKDYNGLTQSLSNTISSFVLNNLTKAYQDNDPYSLDNLGNIAFFEKETMKLYNATKLVDGVYSDFQTFVDQKPAMTNVTAKFKKEELKEVKTPQDGKLKKVSPKDVYAVVVDGQPYIATDKKFIALFLDNDDFYFEDDETLSRVSFAPSFSIGVGSGGYRGGGIGLGVFNQQRKQKVIFMIDYLTGDFVAVDRP